MMEMVVATCGSYLAMNKILCLTLQPAYFSAPVVGKRESSVREDISFFGSVLEERERGVCRNLYQHTTLKEFDFIKQAHIS